MTAREGSSPRSRAGIRSANEDDGPSAWSIEVIGSNGLFKGGRAVAVTFAIACGVFDCGQDFEQQTVMLRR